VRSTRRLHDECFKLWDETGEDQAAEHYESTPLKKYQVPQHPTRHSGPAHQRGLATRLQLEGPLPSDPDGLADLNALASARVLVGQLQHRRLAPVA
jgi:hypothetical protein